MDVYPGKQPPRTIVLTAARLEQVLGIAIPAQEVQRILSGLGFAVETAATGEYRVQPPDWRPDVEIPDDVVEDIGRIYGYDKLPITLLEGKLPEAEPNPCETCVNGCATSPPGLASRRSSPTRSRRCKSSSEWSIPRMRSGWRP